MTLNLNWVLLINALVMCGYMLARLRRATDPQARNFRRVVVGIMAGMAAAWIAIPDIAGYCATGLLLYLWILPALATSRVQSALFRHDYIKAARLMRTISILLPSRNNRSAARLFAALAIANNERVQEALRDLEALEREPGPTAFIAGAHRRALSGNWSDVVSYLKSRGDDLYRNPGLVSMLVRAHGESGELDAMADVIQKSRQVLQEPHMVYIRFLSGLYALAFAGYPDQVAGLWRWPLGDYPESIREAWMAVARMAAGDASAADQFHELTAGFKAIARIAWQAARRRPVPYPPAVLTPERRMVIQDLAKTLQAEAQCHDRLHPSVAKPPWATYAIILTILILFLVEWVLGGMQDASVLWRLGALKPDELLKTRPPFVTLMTSLFLHAGPLHVSLNLLMLYMLGRRMEPWLGRTRFMICYFLSGVLAMATVAWTALQRGVGGRITVGASAAIMGLVGAEAALLWRLWRVDKQPVHRRDFQEMLSVIAIQAAVDLLTPQVSFTGHLSGACFGFLFGLILHRSDASSTHRNAAHPRI